MKRFVLLLITLLTLSSCNNINFEAVKDKINEIIEFHKNNQINKFTKERRERISDSSFIETYKISLDDNYYYLGYSHQERWVYYLDNYVYDVTLDKTFFSVTGRAELTHKIKPITTSFANYLFENKITNYNDDLKLLSYEIFLLDILSSIDKGDVEKYYNFEFEGDVFRINGVSSNETSKVSTLIEYKNNVVSTTKWNVTNLLDNTNYEFINTYSLECDVVYPDLSESELVE